MKIKLNNTTSDKQFWLEVTDITEIVTGNTSKISDSQIIIEQGTSLAICKWKVVNENDAIVIPPPTDNYQFVQGSLPKSSYDLWDKTEEHFSELLIANIMPLISSQLV